MKLVRGIWLPDTEEHLVMMLGRNPQVRGKGSYQYHKYQAALLFVEQRRVAVDIGAHVGLWSIQMAHDFKRVHAFEPVPLHRQCFHMNVPEKNVTLWDCALSDKVRRVSLVTPNTKSRGDTWVVEGSDVAANPLDMLELQDVDFLKTDCEGYELLTLKGAEETLKRCHPTAIVEQKEGMAGKFGLPEQGAVTYLMSLGAKMRREISGDYILSWDN